MIRLCQIVNMRHLASSHGHNWICSKPIRGWPWTGLELQNHFSQSKPSYWTSPNLATYLTIKSIISLNLKEIVSFKKTVKWELFDYLLLFSIDVWSGRDTCTVKLIEKSYSDQYNWQQSISYFIQCTLKKKQENKYREMRKIINWGIFIVFVGSSILFSLFFYIYIFLKIVGQIK